MTTITLEDFFAKAAENEELGAKLGKLLAEHDEAIVKLAAEYGYEFDETEELDDSELDNAAGGAVPDRRTQMLRDYYFRNGGRPFR